jgi:hypothetical protein
MDRETRAISLYSNVPATRKQQGTVMTLEKLVHNVEERLFQIGRRLLNPPPKVPSRSEAEVLAENLAERRAALEQAQTERAETQRRLGEKQKAAALLTSKIETCLHQSRSAEAYRNALDLERIREAIARDQDELPRQDQVCWSLGFNIRQLERRLKQLKTKSPSR